MGNYGEAAIRSIELITENSHYNPVSAWNQATTEIFGKGTSSQKKGCPKNAFIGLCEAGLVKGVTFDRNLESKNKSYAINAIHLLKKDPTLVNDMNELWNKVLNGESKVHNSQMDVVISLWKNNLIEGFC
ncbi:DUF6979 family protein [Gottfriedia acidiceleris]|uniref:DUF6979 family protein n=1 Tax=Gottfriedia acidiceleris TaxID=371036 RepID=UPI002FFF7882